jgi:hypothetical protein
VLQPAADFVRLNGAEFEEVARALGLAHEVERLPVMLEDGPGRLLAVVEVNVIAEPDSARLPALSVFSSLSTLVSVSVGKPDCLTMASSS